MFRDIDPYSATLTDAYLRGRGKASPALFENRKNYPDCGKKSPDCFDLWVKFSIQNVVLRESRRNFSKIFLCGGSFSRVFDMFLNCSVICTVTLCDVKQQIHSEFWNI